MTFKTAGDRQNPAVMLIHGMISSGADCEPFGRCLADDYYVIMPTLDGHGDDARSRLTLPDCTAYIGLVAEDARTRFRTDELYACATSFGGYLALL